MFQSYPCEMNTIKVSLFNRIVEFGKGMNAAKHSEDWRVYSKHSAKCELLLSSICLDCTMGSEILTFLWIILWHCAMGCDCKAVYRMRI